MLMDSSDDALAKGENRKKKSMHSSGLCLGRKSMEGLVAEERERETRDHMDSAPHLQDIGLKLLEQE